MFTLKQLNEKLGEARKRKKQAVDSRASKLQELEALMKADSPDQEKIDTVQGEINSLKADIEKENSMIENYTDQIADLSEVNNYPEEFQGFHPGAGGQGGEEKEISNYSLVKAVREASDPNRGLTGLEKEMHQEAQKNARENGVQLEGNLAIPQQVVVSQFRNDLTVDGGAGGDQGGITVQTTKGSLIDILKAKLPFTELGATFFTELVGDVSFPRANEDTDPAEKTEVAAADESSPTFDDVTLSPRRVPTFTEVSRKLLKQSSVSVEEWLRNHLMYKVAKVMHDRILNDILNASGTNAISHGTDGGSPTWAKIVEFETKVFDSDAANEDEPRLAYLTNSKVKGTLKTTEKSSGTAQFLWDDDNEVNNYAAVISSLVPDDLTKGTGTALSAMIFANWASLYIGQWGGIDMLVNPYSRDTEGLVRVNAWTWMDSALRHGSAFSVAKDIITNS